MNLNDVYSQLYSFKLADLIPLTDIQTEKDKNVHRDVTYLIGYTEAEWRAKYPEVDVHNLYYAPVLVSGAMVYFDKEKLIWLALPIIPGLKSEQEKDFPGNFLKALKSMESEVAAGNRTRSLLYMPDGIRMEAIGMLLEKEGPSPKIYELFNTFYPIGDCFTSMFPDDFAQKLMACKSSEQKSDTEKALAKIDGEEVTVYRGAADGSASPKKALSWTLDLNIAYMFALKTGNQPRILTGVVKKENILEYFDTAEKEIVVLPGTVTVLSDEPQFTPDEDEILNCNDAVFSIFKKEKTVLKKLYRFRHRGDHDAQHSMRVLFLVLLLGGLEGVSNTKLRLLAEAAVYHDLGRNNNDADESHGEASAELYAEKMGRKADKTVQYLIRCHCIADSEGERQADSEQDKKLLAIFKDADALDRIRFGAPGAGPDCLDVAQLRTQNAKRLVLIARLAEKMLEY